jgi:hypothetical protein
MRPNEHLRLYQPCLATIRAAGVRYVIGGSYPLRRWRRVNDIDAQIHPIDASKLTETGLGEWLPAPSGSGHCYVINTPAGRIERFDTPNIAGFGYADMGSTAGVDERDEFGNEDGRWR